MEKILANKISAIAKQQKTTIIAVCGAADLGKSYLAQNTASHLQTKNISCNHLPLDAFLINRAQRLEQGLSGYQAESYDIPSALQALEQHRNKQTINYAPYQHETGCKSPVLTPLLASPVLILDGLQSMHQCFRPYIHFSIFIETTDDYLKKLRFEADTDKRKLGIQAAQNNIEPEFSHYQRSVAHYKKEADCLIFLEKKWHYRLI